MLAAMAIHFPKPKLNSRQDISADQAPEPTAPNKNRSLKFPFKISSKTGIKTL
jgi:hypothetical protein